MNLITFLNMERRYSPRPFSNLGLLGAGFFSHKADLYPFSSFDRELFVSDWEVEVRSKGVNDVFCRQALRDKLLFHRLLPEGMTPHFLGFVKGGIYRSFGRFSCLEDALEKYGSLFLKPHQGAAGKGILKVSTPSEIPVSGTYIVEGKLEGAGYAAHVYPQTLNTLRLLTCTDEQGPFVVGAVQRFGTNASGNVDNFSMGGIASAVDLANGVLSAGVAKYGAKGIVKLSAHPDTGHMIEGLEVPEWERVKDAAMSLSRYFPGLKYVGWDIAITPEGPVVIEGNGDVPNPNLLQAHRPLLLTSRVIKFMHSVGIISRAHRDSASRSLSHIKEGL